MLPRLRSLVRESDAVLDIADNHRRLEQIPLRLGVLAPEHSIVSADTLRRELVEPRVSREIALLRSAEHDSAPAAKALWDSLLTAE